MRRLALFALLLTACSGALAEEAASILSLQQQLQALRAQNVALQRENSELKAQIAGTRTTQQVAGKAEPASERQEDKPENRLKLPSNVTINHNPR